MRPRRVAVLLLFGSSSLFLTGACSGTEPSAPRESCDGGTDVCPAGETCAYISGNVEACVPFNCAALASCCFEQGFVDDWSDNQVPAELNDLACQEVVQTESTDECGAKLAEMRNAGYCHEDRDGYGAASLCGAEGALCTLELSIVYKGGSCCDGLACDDPDDDGAYHCGVCVREGEHCAFGETNSCCDGFYCETFSQLCVPLKEDGEDCTSFTECLSEECDEICGQTSTGSGGPSGPGGSSNDGSQGASCDPQSCNGSESDCSEFGCLTCWYSCSGDACTSQCSDPF